MTDAGGRGRVRLGELVDAALADTEPAAHAGFVADLAAVTRTADAVAAVADRLLAADDRGRRVLLEWLARLRVLLPPALLDTVLPLLSDPATPDALRARVAARALRSAPDRKRFLPTLAAALAAGVTPLAALARLRAVQGRFKRSPLLDALVARRERRLRLACPRCAVRLPRDELAKHLFAAHGLVLHDGRAQRPERIARDLRKRYAAARDTTLLDTAARLSDPAALRRWAARAGATAADLAPLLADAAASGTGLCPRCFAEVPPSVAPLPPPLTLAGGRLVGDGYGVEIGTRHGLRTCTVSTPGGVLRAGLDGRRAVGPRALGVVAAVLVLAGAFALRLPARWALPAAAAAYVVARLLRAPLPAPGDQAIDRAWTTLVPHAAPDDPFLVRLCRASAGRGDPEERVAAVAAVASWAERAPLRAAVGFLHADDAAAFGADRVATVAELLIAELQNNTTLAGAEYVADLYLARGPAPAERARLRVLVLACAFAAGWTPRRLVEAAAGCPRLRELVVAVPASRLALQYAAWQLRDRRPWEPEVSAGTAFDLARVAPGLGGRLLAEHPDLLLYHRPVPAVDEVVGWVLVTARGVVVGGHVVADSDAVVKTEGGRLVFGPHRIPFPKRPPAAFVSALLALLRVRADVLLPRIDAALEAGVRPAAVGGLVRKCECGASVVVSVGEVGRAVG